MSSPNGISHFAITTEHAQNIDNIKIFGNKHEEATVHFQWRRTLHFLQKHTFENYLIFIPTYVNRTCEIQVSWRSEAQTVGKIQVQNVFVKAAKFTPLKMYNSLVIRISNLSSNITHNASWFIMAKGLIDMDGSRQCCQKCHVPVFAHIDVRMPNVINTQVVQQHAPVFFTWLCSTWKCRHENESLKKISRKCVKMDKNVSKHPEYQQNGVQNFLKSGNFLKMYWQLKHVQTALVPFKCSKRWWIA